MNDLPDDKTLDDYLKRDSAVSQHYRNLETDDVPPALDSAVLARAREALTVKSSKRPAWTRWSAPIALAASLVLGIAVVLEVGVEEQVSLPAPQSEQVREAVSTDLASFEAIEQVTDQPLADTPAKLSAPKLDAPPAAPVRQTQSERSMKANDSVASAKREAAVAARERDEVSRRQEPFAPAPPPAAATPPSTTAPNEEVVATAASRELADRREAEARRDRQITASAGYSRASGQVVPFPNEVRKTSASASVLNSPQEAEGPRLEPLLWLEQIRMLRREGKVLDADEQWRQFVKTYPDFEVAANDVARSKP